MREYDCGNTGSQKYLQSKRAKSCHPTHCTCHSRSRTCNNRKHPPSIVRTGRAKALCRCAKGKRGVEVPGLSAHGTIDNLQLVFPEIGRAAERPGECSAAIAATNRADPGPRECSAAIAATSDANPDSRERPAAVAATNSANPGPGQCSEEKSATSRANPVS